MQHRHVLPNIQRQIQDLLCVLLGIIAAAVQERSHGLTGTGETNGVLLSLGQDHNGSNGICSGFADPGGAAVRRAEGCPTSVHTAQKRPVTIEDLCLAMLFPEGCLGGFSRLLGCGKQDGLARMNHKGCVEENCAKGETESDRKSVV